MSGCLNVVGEGKGNLGCDDHAFSKLIDRPSDGSLIAHNRKLVDTKPNGSFPSKIGHNKNNHSSLYRRRSTYRLLHKDISMICI